MEKVRWIRRCLIVTVGFLLAMPSCSKPASAPPSSPVSHQEAARELFAQLGGKGVAEATSEAMLNAILSSNPKLAEHEAIVRSWCRKGFLDGTFESEITGIYVKQFTEQEIRELTAFYRTPLGQKALKAMPNIAQQSTMVGIRYAQAHGQELKMMLSEAVQKKQAAPTPKK